jgi:hypothetical protein
MMLMRDEAATAEAPVSKPRYRVSFEAAADSPEELQRHIAKGLGREVKRAKRKVSSRKLR